MWWIKCNVVISWTATKWTKWISSLSRGTLQLALGINLISEIWYFFHRVGFVNKHISYSGIYFYWKNRLVGGLGRSKAEAPESKFIVLVNRHTHGGSGKQAINAIHEPPYQWRFRKLSCKSYTWTVIMETVCTNVFIARLPTLLCNF